jgi:hypothetical protein
MCYKWEWFQWRRAAEANEKREQSKTLPERTRTKPQPERATEVVRPDQASKRQEELESV